MKSRIELDMDLIHSEAPNAWKDFVTFFNEYYEGEEVVYHLEPEHLPLTIIVGAIIEYFNEEGIDLTLYDTKLETIKEAIEEAFLNQEHNLGHFS